MCRDEKNKKIQKKWKDIKYIFKASWCLFLFGLKDLLLWFGKKLVLGVERVILEAVKIVEAAEKLENYCDALSDKIEAEDKENEAEY